MKINYLLAPRPILGSAGINTPVPLSGRHFFIWLVAFIIFSFSGPIVAQEIQFEAEAGTLSNGATVQDCTDCSGGKQVGDLGNGAVEFTISLDAPATYNLQLHYSSGDPRSIFVTVNGQISTEIPCAPSGGWTTVGTTFGQIDLGMGNNTIRFDNPGGYGPNLDGFSLIPAATYVLSGRVLRNGIPLEDVQLNLSGALVSTTTTDINGFYNFLNLVEGKDYIVTPSSQTDVFFPISYRYEAISTDHADQDFVASDACVECERIFPYGNDGELVYNTQTGTVSVWVDGTKTIDGAYSEALINDALLKSTEYSLRTISETDINDSFGTGKKITVTLSAVGLPDMQQVFFTYPDKDYFLTEVVINGDQIRSNYMAPLISNNVLIGPNEDNRVLFVPFDNDAFVRYRSVPVLGNSSNTSAEVTAFYGNIGRQGLVVGSVEHTTWKTGVRTTGTGSNLSELKVWGGYTDEAVTRDETEHGSITGNSVKSPKIFVGIFNDWRRGMELYGTANSLNEPGYLFEWEEPVPFGWNSWGAIQSDINLEKAKAVVDFVADDLPLFRSGETAYIDLDSYWDNMVNGGLEGDFGQLTEFVEYCLEKGLKPGIYWAPFVDWGKYDRKVEGSSYNYSSTWTLVNGEYNDMDGARAMDPTHPATKQRIDLVIDKFKQSGFEMIKIDFIGHAAIEGDSFYDPNVTTGMQAFKQGMEYLVDRLDNQMLVYAAISPNLATGRYAHSRRIACDAYADINATEYTLNSTTYGWWQSNIYDFTDADHLVFGNEQPGATRARLTSGILNGTIILGDDFSAPGMWTETAKTLLRNSEILELARNGRSFAPVEGNSESGASEQFVSKVGDVYYVAIVNYGGEKEYNVPLSRLGIPGNAHCIKELYSGLPISLQGSDLQVNIGERDAAIYAFHAGTDCVFNMPHENYRVRVTDATCIGAENGSIELGVADVRYNYTVTISDIGSFSLPNENNEWLLKIPNLLPDVYTACITIMGVEGYEECFEVTVGEPETLRADTDVNGEDRTVTLKLSGSQTYTVAVNGNLSSLDSGNHILKLRNGMNEISVKGELDCQGSYTERIFVSEGVQVSPNPNIGPISIKIPGEDRAVTIGVYGLSGSELYRFQKKVPDSRNVALDLASLRKGIYILKIRNRDIDESLKIIRQ